MVPSLYDSLESQVLTNLIEDAPPSIRKSNALEAIKKKSNSAWYPKRDTPFTNRLVLPKTAYSIGETNDSTNHLPTITTSPKFQLEHKERVITLVHIGKAGGMTVRGSTSLLCRLSPTRYDTPEKVQRCIQNFLPPHNVLDRAVQHYFHMYAFELAELANSTSFLVTIRNPVDRVISNFRYSHPVNCNQPKWDRRIATRPWGCEVREHIKKALSSDYRLYQQCFPSTGMEDLAQSVLSPWPNTTHFIAQNWTWAQQQNCRWIARNFIQGQWKKQPSPHMHYNYEYYRNWTLEAFPHKEFFAIRTTSEWDDMKALDLAMGGRGFFRKEGRHESHGSEFFEPSPLSPQAYQKLCCVLEREIEMYQDFVDHMINLDEAEKEECMEDVRRKGRISDWTTWRQECQRHLALDEQVLIPFQSEGNNQFVRAAKAIGQVRQGGGSPQQQVGDSKISLLQGRDTGGERLRQTVSTLSIQ